MRNGFDCSAKVILHHANKSVIYTYSKSVSSLNASVPISVTLVGILILRSAVQPWNAYSPIVVTPSGIVTLVSEAQLLNASFPIKVTLLSNVITPMPFL